MVQAPSTAPSNLMTRAILMSPNRTKHCLYGYIYIYTKIVKMHKMLKKFVLKLEWNKQIQKIFE